MVVLSPAAGRAVPQNHCLAKDCLVFSKLSFADRSPRVPRLPVVSPNCYQCPRGTALGPRKLPLPYGQTSIEGYEQGGLTGHCDHSLPLARQIILLRYPDCSRQGTPEQE